jgi:hypothetical protein
VKVLALASSLCTHEVSSFNVTSVSSNFAYKNIYHKIATVKY